MVAATRARGRGRAVSGAEGEGEAGGDTANDDVDRQLLCDGRQPAIDTSTGRRYSCEACPPGSYCHRLSTASACCWIGNHLS